MSAGFPGGWILIAVIFLYTLISGDRRPLFWVLVAVAVGYSFSFINEYLGNEAAKRSM